LDHCSLLVHPNGYRTTAQFHDGTDKQEGRLQVKYFMVFYLSDRDGWVLTTFIPRWLQVECDDELEREVARYAESMPNTIYFVADIIPR
jgi:hypothetical protein